MPDTGTVLLLLIGFGVLGYVVTVLVRRQRRHVWSDFARRHRLRLVTAGDDEAPAVLGRIDGREFRLELARIGSDSELGVEEVHIGLQVHGTLPGGLRIESASGLIGAARRAQEDRVVETGDEDFDTAVVVIADQPDQARSYLNEDRRRALLEVADYAPGVAALEGDRLLIEDRTVLSDLARLDAHLVVLRRVAPILDGDQPAAY